MFMIKFLDLEKITEKNFEEIKTVVTKTISSGWYLQGEANKLFETNYSSYIGTEYTVGCANGLDALIWIYRAYIELGIMKEGDEVIVPANTYIASILAITENNLIHVLVEPDIDTLEIDDAKIEEKIRIENVTKKFGSYAALDGISLSFEKGKIHGMIGRNGSGKTVLFKCICGFLRLYGVGLYEIAGKERE